MPDHQFVLTLSCPDRPGIVSAVSTFLAHNGQNILDAQQFNDVETGHFFMRVVFTAADLAVESGGAADRLRRDRRPLRHGLADARPRQPPPGDAAGLEIRSLPGRYPVSLAHRRTRDDPDRDRLQPSARDLRQSRFRRDSVSLSAGHEGDQARAGDRGLESGRQNTRTDLVVLARYMQILSDEMSARLSGRCINIHHSFLPGFKGARPYHQAHERGVKLIGATAHYVTSALDEGPIIDQDVERISHRDTPEDLVAQGPRHRTPRAGARHAPSSGGSRDPQRPQDRGVHGLIGPRSVEPGIERPCGFQPKSRAAGVASKVMSFIMRMPIATFAPGNSGFASKKLGAPQQRGHRNRPPRHSAIRRKIRPIISR